jgi:rhomboid family GlyGly-CTERM serine protease
LGAALVALLSALLAVGIFSSTGVSAVLQYDRAAIASGELWRLVTCHWTHWSFEHLLWDVSAFAVLAFACASRAPGRFAWTMALCSLAIPVVVCVGLPEMQTYRGLSGIASALLVLVMCDVSREAPRGLAFACGGLLVAFTAKVVYEAVTGTCVFVDGAASGFVPVPLAHAVGAGVGAAVGAVRRSGASRGEAAGLPIAGGATRLLTLPRSP